MVCMTSAAVIRSVVPSMLEGGAVPTPPPLLPHRRTSRYRSQDSSYNDSEGHVAQGLSDGGTGGVPSSNNQRRGSIRRKSIMQMANHQQANGVPAEAGSTGAGGDGNWKKGRRRDSQLNFHGRMQTFIVFDWDDTLFPTTYVQEDLGLEWRYALERQQGLSPRSVTEVREKLQACEACAIQALQRAMELAHVVIITLAGSGWVDMSCCHFYPTMGKLLREIGVPIIYAQEKANQGRSKEYNKQDFKSDDDIERFWGLIKGRAIADEADRFYSQYEGQSWKNLLSIGDSNFERYGLLAATSAYMANAPLDTAGGAGGPEVCLPSQQGCWEKVQDGHVKKLRAKCCKLVDQPDIDELTVELEMVARWLEGMVRLDDGFDLDLEALDEESQVVIIEEVLRGDRPVADMPRLPEDC